MEKIKNIAIIAHVDHGKTTLVDALLMYTNAIEKNSATRVMDSNDLERERGITIFSKNATIRYKDYKINIVDTPGHADFGGEVQRILKTVDSVLLVVDAFEGVMPQTKYVLKQALDHGLSPIVVINKIDRENAEPEKIVDQVFDLFVELGANEEQLDFEVVYTSAKSKIAKYDLNDDSTDMKPLIDTIITKAKDAITDYDLPFQMLVTNIEYDNYVGKLANGRIYSGSVSKDDEIVLVKQDGTQIKSRVSRIYGYEGLKRVELTKAFAGDIINIAGISEVEIGETLSDKDDVRQLPTIVIDEPTLAMDILVNDSPFAGKEGKFVTSRAILERLQKEVRNNVAIRLEVSKNNDVFTLKVRGELQLSILIENMRREGFEIQVSKPQVIFRTKNGVKEEPMEYATIEVDDEYVGVVIEKMGVRKGELLNMSQSTDGYTTLEFSIPTRSLIGFRNEFLTSTRGTGILNHAFMGYEPYKGDFNRIRKGVLISMENGVSTGYALNNIQSRGILFINPATEVYEGMIVGEHNRDNDLIVNVCKGKKLTNMRAAGSDDNIKLAPPYEFSLELALEYIEDDELLEITPSSIRLRKKYLSENERKKKQKEKEGYYE